MLDKRIDAIDMRLGDLKQESAKSSVSFEHSRRQIVHIVDEELWWTARDQVQVTDNLANEFPFRAMMVQDLNANRDRFHRELVIQIILYYTTV